jgi:SAM-dependent methyltransferase
MPQSSLPSIQTRYRQTETVNRYDQSRYGDMVGRVNCRAMRAALRKALKYVPACGRILDMPCGTGIFTWFLSHLGYKTFAGDISLEMIGMTRTLQRQAAPTPHFFQGDIFRLPFRNRSFDAILCMRFMNLMDRPLRVAAVEEMARVSGVVIVSYYHKYSLKYLSRMVRYKLGLRNFTSPRLSRRALMDEIKDTGLKLITLISVAPMLSEAWIAVLVHPENQKH